LANAASSCGELGSMPAETSIPMLPLFHWLQLPGNCGNPCLCMQATSARLWRCCCSVRSADGGWPCLGSRWAHAALVDRGASNLELFDGLTMKAPELLGSG